MSASEGLPDREWSLAHKIKGGIVGDAESGTDPALIFPGPVALVAGPGSGKTTRLARRIKYLVEEQGADPGTITVITFTVEAARNMKARLTPPAKKGMPDVTLPPELHPLTICTMHSLGARIINENSDRLGIDPGSRLVTSRQVRQMLFEDAARLCGEESTYGAVCDEIKRTLGVPTDERQTRVFDAYQLILRACNAIDYDDQIILACQVLRSYKEVRDVWHKKTAHLLVDEYQDINPAQLELIQLLCGNDALGLFVVGDDDQSIYGFRGAKPMFIRDFRKHFGEGGRIEAIPDCFRCQPHVIRAAHGFITAFNPGRIEKPEPKCNKPQGPMVSVNNVPSDTKEAQVIARMAEDALHEGDVLILLPKPDYAEPLKTELRKRRIAFDAPIQRDTYATLVFSALRNWLEDPGDNLAFRELLQAIMDSGLLDIPGRKVRRADKIAEREEAFTNVSALWRGVLRGATFRETLRDAAQTSAIRASLNRLADDLAQATAGTPTELGQRTFEALKPWVNSARMLDELASSPTDARGSRDGDANLVRIMTMRNSKGLEANTVFVVGLEDGTFPASNHGTDEFEEEARLFYVSMTCPRVQYHSLV